MTKLRPASMAPCSKWLVSLAGLVGEASNSRLPTVTRAVGEKRAPEDPAGKNRLATLVNARWLEYRFAQPTGQHAGILCIAGSNGMLKQPSSKERETLGGCRKDCTVAALLHARLSSNKGSTECIRRARAGNSFWGQIIAWQLDHCLFVEGLLQRRLSSGRCLKLFVLPEEVMHRQPQKVDSKSPARRLTHLADHHDSDEKAAWETSLRSVAGPRTEASAFGLESHAPLATLRWGTRHQRGQSVFHCLLSGGCMVAGHTTAVCCHRRCVLDAVDLCAGCGVPRCDLHIAQCSLCGRGMFCHICVESR